METNTRVSSDSSQRGKKRACVGSSCLLASPLALSFFLTAYCSPPGILRLWPENRSVYFQKTSLVSLHQPVFRKTSSWSRSTGLGSFHGAPPTTSEFLTMKNDKKGNTEPSAKTARPPPPPTTGAAQSSASLQPTLRSLSTPTAAACQSGGPHPRPWV